MLTCYVKRALTFGVHETVEGLACHGEGPAIALPKICDIATDLGFSLGSGAGPFVPYS